MGAAAAEREGGARRDGARLDAFVTYATSRGASVILDPHNYARYFGKVVGSDVGNDVLADFWSKVAVHYARNARVVFALMNEPHDLPSEQWARAAQAAIDAIRATGAANLILVPGVEWTGAHSWTESFYGTPNSPRKPRRPCCFSQSVNARIDCEPIVLLEQVSCVPEKSLSRY